MRSRQNSAAGCTVWCGLVASGAAGGLLLAVLAEFVWPTPVGEGGPLAGAGVLGVVLWRAVMAGLVGAVLGGALAGWAVGRLRRNGGGHAESSAELDPDRGQAPRDR